MNKNQKVIVGITILFAVTLIFLCIIETPVKLCRTEVTVKPDERCPKVEVELKWNTNALQKYTLIYQIKDNTGAVIYIGRQDILFPATKVTLPIERCDSKPPETLVFSWEVSPAPAEVVNWSIIPPIIPLVP